MLGPSCYNTKNIELTQLNYMTTITKEQPIRRLKIEIATIIIIKLIFLYIIWSIVFSQRDPAMRTTDAMTARLINQTFVKPALLQETP